jgi:2-polyprenyl-3-methyl-5-hydroxy-6-metoxy-1,4-benzoquinol methylase
MDQRQSNEAYYPSSDYEVPKANFISYWHQINEVLKTKPKTFLEIGVGEGLVSNYLKRKKINVTTFDIDKKLNPTVTGEVQKLSKYFKENSFDTVLCAEVLEHLPFSYFEKSLREIHKVTKKNVIISLPHHALQFLLHIKIPLIRPIILTMRIPFPFHHKWKEGHAHYWEIGWKGYPLERVKKEMSRYFKIKKVYPVPEKPYHWFFILEARNKRKPPTKNIN